MIQPVQTRRTPSRAQVENAIALLDLARQRCAAKHEYEKCSLLAMAMKALAWTIDAPDPFPEPDFETLVSLIALQAETLQAEIDAAASARAN
jgi:hypothetical protein